MSETVEPGCGLMHKRTPWVTVEMQFRPPVPSELRPYFWGCGMLSFYAERHRKVREFKLADLPGGDGSGPRMSVRDAGNGFGWVLVIEMSHEHAKTALDQLGLPHAVETFEVAGASS